LDPNCDYFFLLNAAVLHNAIQDLQNANQDLQNANQDLQNANQDLQNANQDLFCKNCIILTNVAPRRRRTTKQQSKT
jgi:hypothetical protein